jgi:hypothetical protein
MFFPAGEKLACHYTNKDNVGLRAAKLQGSFNALNTRCKNVIRTPT